MDGDTLHPRYLQLLAVINGWRAPALDWFTRALSARTPA